MIKIESVHVEETRGIRSLDIDLGKKNFAISGPNGSGKSGVIDSIEFALTGEIKRLTGSGTKGLSVTEHGPHVDKAKFPDASFVELRVFLPKLGKSAKIKRSINSASKLEISPDEPEVREILDTIAAHPEITLSRRDIIRFILVEPSKRSQEIQALLKLDELGTTRATLNTTQNRLKNIFSSSQSNARSARDALTRHLVVDTPSKEEVLTVVNQHRATLGLDLIEELKPDTKLDAGLEKSGSASRFNKTTALNDVSVLSEAAKGIDDLGAADVKVVLEGIAQLESDPALFKIIQQLSLIEKGLDLIDGPSCPLCDLPWDSEDHLRAHLAEKLDKAKEASALANDLSAAGLRLAQAVSAVTAKLGAAIELNKADDICVDDEAAVFDAWRIELLALKAKLTSVDQLVSLKGQFEQGWLETPKSLKKSIESLDKEVRAVPDQSSIVAAQSFLTTAQVRFQDFLRDLRNEAKAKKASASAKAAYNVYCIVMEKELNALYDEVQEDFSTYYREINEDDEDTFSAKFTPSAGALALEVNFYERGLFPPGAYHSEGHQDGMGVCLYLALMKRLFGDDFSFALLDDVVMSVDSGHRYQFCKLLKSHFPNTQFVLTTHDRLWAEQMKSAGLVTSKSSIAFHSWSVDTGPLVESRGEIWDEIESSLDKGKVEIAGLSLRRHLEYFATHLCDELGAQPQFRADGNYELGDLLPAALSRMKTLLGKSTNAAQSWGNDADKSAAIALKKALSESSGLSQVEQWAVNKAVHYNEWANFGKMDFQPVVFAFKELLQLFHCKTCDSWLYATPRKVPEALRCSCGATNFNLNEKPK